MVFCDLRLVAQHHLPRLLHPGEAWNEMAPQGYVDGAKPCCLKKCLIWAWSHVRISPAFSEYDQL